MLIRKSWLFSSCCNCSCFYLWRSPFQSPVCQSRWQLSISGLVRFPEHEYKTKLSERHIYQRWVISASCILPRVPTPSKSYIQNSTYLHHRMQPPPHSLTSRSSNKGELGETRCLLSPAWEKKENDWLHKVGVRHILGPLFDIHSILTSYPTPDTYRISIHEKHYISIKCVIYFKPIHSVMQHKII